MTRSIVGTCLAMALLATTGPAPAGEVALRSYASDAEAAHGPCEQRPAHAKVTYTSPADAEEGATYGIFIAVLRPTADAVKERTYLKFVAGPNQSTDLCVRVTPAEHVVVFIQAIHTATAKFDSGDFGTLFVQSLGYTGPVDPQLYNSGIAYLAVSGTGR
jgi:hypothetical protein